MGDELSSLPRPARAMVIGASGGIGAALVTRLATLSLDVKALARRPLAIDRGNVTFRPVDLVDEESIALACGRCRPGPPLRMVIVASGLLHNGLHQPEKNLRALDVATLTRAFAINTIGPALVAKHSLPLLPRQGKSVFAVLSARVGSIEDNRLGGWHGYRASKAALNQIVRTLAVEMKRSHPEAVVVALHPGTVATNLSAPFRGNVSSERLFTPAQAAGHLLDVVDGLTPSDSGGFFAWDGSSIPF